MEPIYFKPTSRLSQGIQGYPFKALKTLAEVPGNYAANSQKRARTSPNDEGRYPYKYSRGDSPFSKRLPRPVDIKELSEWHDSVNM